MTLDVNTPEHDALMEEFEKWTRARPWLMGWLCRRSPDSCSLDHVYNLDEINKRFLAFRAGYELGRKGEVGVSEGSAAVDRSAEETCGDCEHYWRRPEAVGCSADPRFVISAVSPACPYFGRRSEA